MKAKRTQVEPNIYQYPDGRYEIRLMVAGRTLPPERFRADTSLTVMRDWIAGVRKDGAAAAVRVSATAPGSGSLEEAAPAFFRQIQGRPGSAADRSHFRAWFDVVVDGRRLGAMSPHAILTKHINEAIGQWQTGASTHTTRTVRVAGYARGGRVLPGHVRSVPATSRRVVSALTIRHRCRVLTDFFHALGKKTDPTPVDDAKVPKRGRALPVTVPPAIVIAVLQRLAALDAQTYGRFAVAATTGQRPCQVGRAHPEDVVLDSPRPYWMVRPAKDEPAHLVELNEIAVAAWHAFIAAAAWSFEKGGFDTSRYGRIIHEAGWPKGVRPYNARHSLAAAMAAEDCTLADIQVQLGHLDPKTTKIYTPFVRAARPREVSERTAGYLAEAFKPRLVKGQP